MLQICQYPSLPTYMFALSCCVLLLLWMTYLKLRYLAGTRGGAMGGQPRSATTETTQLTRRHLCNLASTTSFTLWFSRGDAWALHPKNARVRVGRPTPDAPPVPAVTRGFILTNRTIFYYVFAVTRGSESRR